MRGIVYAMHKEVAGALRPSGQVQTIAGMDFYALDPDTVVCICGVGKVNAAMGTQALIDRFGVDEVWNAGVPMAALTLPTPQMHTTVSGSRG